MNNQIKKGVQKYLREIKNLKKKDVVYKKKKYLVEFGFVAPIITKWGKFQLHPLKVKNGKWGRHYFLIYPNLKTLLRQKEIQIRIESGCYSGMVLGDNTCDCLGQLRKGQEMCVQNGSGIIINIPQQDGRGYNEDLKMANQKIMDDHNIDTIKTAVMFYGNIDNIDKRTYEESIVLLKALGFNQEHKILLLTNNPLKIKAFQNSEFNFNRHKSIKSKNHNQVKKHLDAKAKYCSHNFNIK